MAIPNRFGANDNKSMPESASHSYGRLAAWVTARVQRGRDVRDEFWEHRWEEATRLWRGFWIAKDKNTNSERSKIITPALSQAIEMTVAEMEEAIFSRKAWVDIEDDLEDQQREDAIASRDLLLEDFELADVKSAISQVLLIGAIYGTGIAKMSVQIITEYMRTAEGRTRPVKRPIITLIPIRPDEFIIDPAARNVDEALYVAHEMLKPIHGIREKQAAGLYFPGNVSAWNSNERTDPTGTGDTRNINKADEGAMILEYFGRVPRNLMPNANGDERGMVEAIVVVANETTLLKAVENPFTYKDRPVIAYQHETVPGEFWGRSVTEKGYNAQKALDAEMRARMDALALTTAPMMGADVTRLPRNPDLRVRPGKFFLTRGRPSEIIEPVGFQNPSIAAQFQQTGDLERMVQMGTGAMDSATPNNISRRNETASGMGMMQGGFIKRSKRTMYNVERHFLDRLVKKALWRYQQFDPRRYPAQDYKFTVHSTMGMMAKEVENMQLAQMLQFTPPESPAHGIILQALFENTVSDHKAVLHQAIAEMNKPPSEEEQAMQKRQQDLAMAMAEATLAKEQAEAQQLRIENEKLQAETELALAKAELARVQADLEDDKVEIQAANAVTGAEKARQARDQNEVARERNDIERRKINSNSN
ncbi:MAG: hypothetical protein QNJ97_17815 [Myxococcota bacterium]|nr:hypothetical protein [Myxococcota bacterium]